MRDLGSQAGSGVDGDRCGPRRRSSDHYLAGRAPQPWYAAEPSWSSRRVKAESAGDWDKVELLGTGLQLANFRDFQLATLYIILLLQMQLLLLWLQLVQRENWLKAIELCNKYPTYCASTNTPCYACVLGNGLLTSAYTCR